MSEPSFGEHLAYRGTGPVSEILLDRPEKKNALTDRMIDDFVRAVRHADDDSEVRAIVVSGTGEAFCAGGDIGETNAEAAESVSSDSFGPEDERWAVSFRFEPVETPFIAAVNGVCAGAGMEILHATDIRIASSDATFGHPEPGIGVFPAGGATVRLPQQIPHAYAMQFLLTGELFPAAFAKEAGLITEIVDGDVRERAREIASGIGENSPQAVQAIKRSVRETADMERSAAFLHEADIGREVWASEDAKEGIEAFLNGRDPEFRVE
jgi:enoyl-CoA hydratase